MVFGCTDPLVPLGRTYARLVLPSGEAWDELGNPHTIRRFHWENVYPDDRRRNGIHC